MKPPLKILFAGGGTGGHLFSGVAVAQEALRRFPDTQVLFVGTRQGLEKELVPKAGFSVEFLSVSPLKGAKLGHRFKSIAKLPLSFWQSRRILRRFNPDFVIGIGGYASGPMTLTAHFLGKTTAIIEQNSFPGMTNRKLGRFVDFIFIAFEKAREFFPRTKTFLTGNPVRAFSERPREPQGRFTVLLLGGSQGAHAINQAAVEALPGLSAERERLHFIHQTGKTDFEVVRQAYAQANFSAETHAFIDDMGAVYAKADLVIARSGAGTVTELRLRGLPAILVPYPFAADDHQRYNAEEFVAGGAGEMILNRDFDAAKLQERLRFYLDHSEDLAVKRRAAAAQAQPNAAAAVLDYLLNFPERGSAPETPNRSHPGIQS